MKRWLAIPFLLIAVNLHAAQGPYDEAADAKAGVKSALVEAGKAKKSVLVVFGANWCPDCLVLDKAFKTGTAAPLVAKDFEVVKVDIGQYDKNLDLAQSYGIDLKKGVPTVAILSVDGKVLHVTKDSELADARHMGDDGILAFFKKVSAQ